MTDTPDVPDLPPEFNVAPGQPVPIHDLIKRLVGLAPTDHPGALGEPEGTPGVYDEILFEEGKWVPCQMKPGLLTLTGMKRLRATASLLEQVVRAVVPGHVIECGVWRGGQVALMAATLYNLYLQGYEAGPNQRALIACDSFEGCPEPDDAKYPLDREDAHWRAKSLLGVTQEQFITNLIGLFPPHVVNGLQIQAGWFEDTCPRIAASFAKTGEQIAFLRIDGDMYSSTMQVLQALYPHVAKGGVVIVDDYALKNCKAAVDDFRETLRPPVTPEAQEMADRMGVEVDAIRKGAPTMHKIDFTAVYWIKP